MTICSVEGCGTGVYLRGLCVAHYSKKRRDGELTSRSYIKRKTPCTVSECYRSTHHEGLCRDHFVQQVETGSTWMLRDDEYVHDVKWPVGHRIVDRTVRDPNTGCLLWLGYIGKEGYGRPSGGGLAHRVAYEQERGSIPDAAVVHHTCANRLCVNPEHLQCVSHVDNIAEMRERQGYLARIAELEARLQACQCDVGVARYCSVESKDNPALVCTFPDCGRKHRARGYCTTHYNQLAKGLELQPISDTYPRHYVRKPKYCSVEECWEKHNGHGLCKKHYDQKRNEKRGDAA